MEKLKTIEEFLEFKQEIINNIDKNKPCIRICMTGCRAYGSTDVSNALKQELKSQNLTEKIEIRETGCLGFCAKAPVMVIDPEGIFYQQVTPEDAGRIINETIINKKIIDDLVYTDPVSGIKYPYMNEIPFYKGQLRRVLDNCGKIDPKDIKQYISRDGYSAFIKMLSYMTSDEVIDVVEKSGLRGRGGAGFPTGKKWRFARGSRSGQKYIICNADEGDPGAFMDRAVLEGDPHSVLEGMLIGAYAIGATYGYIYVRAEYPIAVEHLKIALAQAENLGLLGENILGSGFSFHLSLKEGAGAFVCGEETALMASIEGKRGMPRSRPPFPAQAGLDGKPTNINNVETWANIRHIILNGWEWFASVGTEESKGTKIFSLAGRINNTGLVEVPIGITMRKIIFDIGGGIPKGRKFKSVQMGGPSGGCVPEKYLDLPIDYGSLQAIGAIMGSGGMIVMDENTCMVEIARFFLNFTRSESCGKCSPCRLGTRQMLEILTRITQGQGREKDLDILIEIANTVKRSSLCGLGQTAGNPVLSTMRYFRNEYEDHIKYKKCSAAVCETLMISSCQHTCPVGVNVPKYVAYIREGKYEEAVEVVRERNPFPAICGRICSHPCESKCRRGELDDPVAIRALKRFVADWYFNNVTTKPEPFPLRFKEKIAVIGAGPTGLTAAFYLRRMGYKVTVFEALGVGGGMLMVGVPEFRLPKKVVEKEIQYIMDRGVEIRFNTPINMNHTIEDLRKEGYKAIFIAAGTQKSQRIGFPGEDAGYEGIYYGLNFLRDVKLERSIEVGKKVVVVGGGNVAIDVARSVRRLPGEREINIVCLESKEEMPAFSEEIEQAIEEGIIIKDSLGINKIVGKGTKLLGIEVKEVESIFDSEGKFNPSYKQGTERFIESDTIIFAVGQAPDLSFLPPDSKLERTRWERLNVDKDTLATNIPGIFAGGDFVRGPGVVINAIAEGRRAAVSIDKYLRKDDTPIELYDLKPQIITEESEEEIQAIPRVEIPLLCVEKRVCSFNEIEETFSEDQAKMEANRCLKCDIKR